MEVTSRSSWQVQAYHMSFLGTAKPQIKKELSVYTEEIYDKQQSQSGSAVSESDVHFPTDESTSAVLGSTQLYENGKIRCIPMPTPDPKDPLNLPNWRKWTAISVLCFFGSLGLAAEIVIGSLLPVFILEYSGVDPTSVLSNQTHATQTASSNPLAVLPAGVTPKVSLMQVSLLATVPQLANGIASYFLIPLSTAVGRRPVLLITAIAAWAGGFWAGASRSLPSHLAARVFHGLGAGAVEALLPLIVQDMVFIHQRGRAIAAVIASQGIFIVVLGVSAPYLSAHYTWRWIYWITSGLGFIAWVLIIAFVPETRWMRSKEELSGQKVYQLEPGENRPRLDVEKYGPRTTWTDIGIFHYGFEWKAAAQSVIDTLRTTFVPTVLFVVAINIAFTVINSATAQTVTFALLGEGVPFEWTGVSAVPSILATVTVYFFGGYVADKISLLITRLHGGQREPEHLLPSLAISFVAGISGCFVFGVAAQNNLHWAVLLLGSFLTLTGTLTALTTTNVFVVESYPQWAGPVLSNKSSLNLIATFFLATSVTTWIQDIGPLRVFSIFAEILIVISLGLPALYFYGKRLRLWTGGKVAASMSKTKTAKSLED